jgi:hypothetical protein
MATVKTSPIPILLLLSVLVLSVAHGQLLTRRQQFNLLRQQQQLDGQENVSVRQSAIQVRTLAFNGIGYHIKNVCHFLQNNNGDVPARTATFERIFDVSFICFQLKHLPMLI